MPKRKMIRTASSKYKQHLQRIRLTERVFVVT